MLEIECQSYDDIIKKFEIEKHQQQQQQKMSANIKDLLFESLTEIFNILKY